MQLLKDDQVDEKALCNLRGVIRTSYTTLNGRANQNLDAFAPEADYEDWKDWPHLTTSWQSGFLIRDERLITS